MIRFVPILMAAAALGFVGCALDADGSGEAAKSSGGGGVTHLSDAGDDVPPFALEDASPGRPPIVVAPGATSEAPDASSTAVDAAPAPDAPGPPPKPGSDDGKKDG